MAKQNDANPTPPAPGANTNANGQAKPAKRLRLKRNYKGRQAGETFNAQSAKAAGIPPEELEAAS